MLILGIKKYMMKKDSVATLNAERNERKNPFFAMVLLLLATLPHLVEGEKQLRPGFLRA